MEMDADEDFQLALQLSLIESQNTNAFQNWAFQPKHETKKRKLDKSPASSSTNTSLVVDPSLELTDPTPDIHKLFVTFDRKFFWSKLGSVEVCWSPRMTSCAGICRYHPVAGACTISLSTPLLKLRPRKDLVETLLHEMIHAFLFVTKNYRDRDDHGPKFQKHMFRINQEGGTNITIYHSFHNEVKLYKTHWWKCDGPCRTHSPYFGYVKRAMNRAPGPNDIWWSRHQATCGGKFIKIKEPENYGQKKNAAVKSRRGTSPCKDISQFFKKPGEPSSSKPYSKMFFHPPKNQTTTNNKGFEKENNCIGSNRKPPQSERSHNIHGFGTLNDKSSTGIKSGGIKSNKGTDTLVVTNNNKNNSNIKDDNVLRIDHFRPFSGAGQTLGGSSTSRNESKLLFIGKNSNSTSSVPKTNSNPTNSTPSSIVPEVVKIENQNFDDETIVLDSDDEIEPDDDMINCPVCNKFIFRSLLSRHLDDCSDLVNIFSDESLDENFHDFSNGENILNNHEDEVQIVSDESKIRPVPENTVNCPSCNLRINKEEINNHLDACLNMLL